MAPKAPCSVCQEEVPFQRRCWVPIRPIDTQFAEPSRGVRVWKSEGALLANMALVCRPCRDRVVPYGSLTAFRAAQGAG